VAKSLPSRPNLDHLRKQAKTLLDDLRAGRAAAIQAFIDHLPDAKGMKPAAVRAANFRLADAQAVIARRTGFASWPGLARHVEQLRGLEGEWRFERLEADGNVMPASMLTNARLLIDGDRFRTESPGASYDGVFTIDANERPSYIDIEFVEGPEAGGMSFGLFELDGDRLTLCLSVLPGGARPTAFAAKRGSGHALEALRRVSASRPADVTGGTPAKEPPATASKKRSTSAVDPRAFDTPMTPPLERLQGEWTPTELVMDGNPMPKEWLAFGLRTMTGNEMKVTFNGQPMAHAKVRVDDRATPVAVDYLHLGGTHKGAVSFGIMQWMGDEVRFLIAAPGDPRPADFESVARTATLSRWRRKIDLR
jgi:uncharacterized protein (TIGR03067 family)